MEHSAHGGHGSVDAERSTAGEAVEAVLHVGGLSYAMSARGVERRLAAQPGVLQVEANTLNQTATVRYDPSTMSLARPRREPTR